MKIRAMDQLFLQLGVIDRQTHARLQICDIEASSIFGEYTHHTSSYLENIFIR